MKPTEEELRICRNLPSHEFEIGDWLIDGKFPEAKPELIYKENIDFSMWDEDRFVWLPTTDQIMTLDVWPNGWCLEKCGDLWFVIEGHNVESGINKSKAPTARLACLRAIESFLESEEDA